MRHNLSISVSNDPKTEGILTCKKISVREKVLSKFLGSKQKIVVLIPGTTVDTVSISEVQQGGECCEQNCFA